MSRNETGPRLCLNLNPDKHVQVPHAHLYILWIHVSANVHHNRHKNIHLEIVTYLNIHSHKHKYEVKHHIEHTHSRHVTMGTS